MNIPQLPLQLLNLGTQHRRDSGQPPYVIGIGAEGKVLDIDA